MSQRGPMQRSLRSGLSLPELLMAFTILAIATLALVSVRTYLLQAQIKIQKVQEATLLASTVMTEIEAAVDQDFRRDLENDFIVDTSKWPESYDYSIKQTGRETDIQKVELTIQWQDQQGRQEFQLWTKFLRD